MVNSWLSLSRLGFEFCFFLCLLDFLKFSAGLFVGYLSVAFCISDLVRFQEFYSFEFQAFATLFQDFVQITPLVLVKSRCDHLLNCRFCYFVADLCYLSFMRLLKRPSMLFAVLMK